MGTISSKVQQVAGSAVAVVKAELKQMSDAKVAFPAKAAESDAVAAKMRAVRE